VAPLPYGALFYRRCRQSARAGTRSKQRPPLLFREAFPPTRAAMKTPWLAAPHVAPKLLETPRLRLRPLLVTDAVRDYDAVMTSRKELWDIFGPGSGWPEESLSLEQDIVDLGWHQARPAARQRLQSPRIKPPEAACAAITTRAALRAERERRRAPRRTHSDLLRKRRALLRRCARDSAAQKEFQLNLSFAFTVEAPDATRILGCVCVRGCAARGAFGPLPRPCVAGVR